LRACGLAHALRVSVSACEATLKVTGLSERCSGRPPTVFHRHPRILGILAYRVLAGDILSTAHRIAVYRERNIQKEEERERERAMSALLSAVHDSCNWHLESSSGTVLATAGNSTRADDGNWRKPVHGPWTLANYQLQLARRRYRIACSASFVHAQ